MEYCIVYTVKSLESFDIILLLIVKNKILIHCAYVDVDNCIYSIYIYEYICTLCLFCTFEIVLLY